MEPAAAGGIHRAGDLALEHHLLLAAEVGIGLGDGVQQEAGVGMEGLVIEVFLGGDLTDLTQEHHAHPVGDEVDHAEVVADEEIGQAAGRLQVLEQVEHLALDRHVQGAHRLVAHHQLGLRAMARAMPMRWRCPPENWWG